MGQQLICPNSIAIDTIQDQVGGSFQNIGTWLVGQRVTKRI